MTQTVSAALDAAGMASFEGGYEKIPAHMQAALRRYVLEGIKPGDFLTAVICNDLRNAVGRADSENLPLLSLYVMWFYNIAPGTCWGSHEAMLKWLAERQADVLAATADAT
jgi:hypothetical protein